MKKVATPKQTGAGGPDFESTVVAYFSATMLNKTPPFGGQSGIITRIDFQVSGDGWLLDDALLTMDDKGAVKKVSVSIKSNQQFNRNGCPKELNMQLWEQYLGHSSSPFRKGIDSMCLIEAPISISVSEDLNTILSQSRAQDADDLHKRIYVPGYSSKAKRIIYESFQCPPELEKIYLVKASETVNLLKHFQHTEMDFERVNSVWERNVIDLCRTLLDSGSTNEAKILFETLCHRSTSLAKVNGFLDIPSLLKHIRGNFSLSGIPDYQSDWSKLKQHNANKLSLISNDLGKKVNIDRSACVQQINEKLLVKPICLIHGISGAGKTVLAKEFVENKKATCKIVWLDVADFDGSVETNLQLQHNLQELIKYDYSNEAYLFIDGAERLYKEKQQQKLALLINNIVLGNLPWKIIIPCSTDGIDGLMGMLNQHNVNTEFIDNFDMPAVDDETVLRLIKEFPDLAVFLMNDGVRNILNNLKLLDKLLFNIKKIATLSQIGSPGETHLIDFIWQEEVENTQFGIQKGALLKIIAEKQADQLLAGVSTAGFDPANISIADELKKAGFIKVEQQKIYFTHDLYSDWARYQLLLSHSDHLASFLTAKSLLSPLWMKAIRLFGLSLLEKDLSGQNWKKTFTSFSNNSSQHIIIQNLLLESFFLSPNTYQILSKQKELLFSNEGKLFMKLMKLFLISGTSANPQILQITKQIGGFTETEASAYDRLPILNYWPDVLLFLHDNIDESLRLALLPVVNVATLWLDKTPMNFIVQKEAGDITLRAAEYIFSQQVKGVYVEDKITEPIYKGLLLGYNQNKDAAGELCRKICKRKPYIEGNDKSESKKRIVTAPSIMDQLPYPKRGAKQWDDGPFERVDNSFQKLCLETNTLLQLLFSNPVLGKEILLAVLIDEPNDRYLGANRYDDDYSIHNPIGWYPPFFLRGPFLNFLRKHPEEAVDFVVRITNFAMDRWLENDREVQKTEQGITLDYNGSSQTYYGDFRVFGWHKNVGNAPHSLISILMAFEQFLYEEIEKGNPIKKYVEYAILQTHSLAIIGVLITVAKLEPTLFLKELKQLLTVPILYNWDWNMNSGYHSVSQADFPESWSSHIEKWKQKKHRSFPLKDTLINIFLYKSDFHALMSEMIPYWEKELEKNEAEGSTDVFLLQMIPQFYKENYKVEENGNWEFIEPKAITERLKAGRENSLAVLQESQVSQKMDMMIENDLPFDLAGAEYLWEKIQTWRQEIEPNDIQNDYVLGSPLTKIASSLPVLINSKDVWITVHPEYSDWIKFFFEYLIDQRLKNNESADSHGTTFDWNVKLASMLPILWKEDIKDKSYRKVIAGTLILFNDTTSNTLFSAASQLFHWDEPEFIKLQNMYLSYYNEKKQVFYNTYPQPDQVRPIQQKYIDAFTNDAISKEFMEWPDLMDFHKDRIMLNCLPDFKNVAQTEQKDYVFFLIKQGLTRMEARLTARLDKLNDNEHVDDFDRTVLVRVADCLPYLTEADKPEFLWGEIIKYGYLASDWITIFFNGFFRIHLQYQDNYPKIIALLSKMILFTDKWSTWETRMSFKRWKDFRNCILGLDPKTVTIWQHEYSEFVKEASSLYSYWFKKNRSNPHTLSSLMSFIISHSGIFFLPEGLQHLKVFFSSSFQRRNEKPPEGNVYVGHKELDDKLASTLSFLWEQKRSLIKNSDEMFLAYRELLQYLVSIENVIAIELQQKLLHL